MRSQFQMSYFWSLNALPELCLFLWKGLRDNSFTHEITSRRLAEKALEAANNRLSNLSARLLQVDEENRRALAHELHDEIGQSLTALKIMLQSLGICREMAVLQGQISTAVGIADAVLNQVRQISLDLRPPQLEDLGYQAAIRWNLERQAKLAGFEARFAVGDIPDKLPENISIAAYRISQEAITNAVKHAHAKHVCVALKMDERGILIEVQDDGVGFDQSQIVANQFGMGLSSMQERAILVNGRLKIISRPGVGCLVKAVLPLK